MAPTHSTRPLNSVELPTHMLLLTGTNWQAKLSMTLTLTLTLTLTPTPILTLTVDLY